MMGTSVMKELITKQHTYSLIRIVGASTKGLKASSSRHQKVYLAKEVKKNSELNERTKLLIWNPEKNKPKPAHFF